MVNDKHCKKCKYYDSKRKNDCTKLEKLILDYKDARKCRYYKKRKGRRKRCKTCMYLKYAYVPKRKRMMYVCSKSGKPRVYTELVHCEQYKKLNNDLSFGHVKQSKRVED